MSNCLDCPPDFECKKEGKMTDIDGNKLKFKIERQICLPQSNKPDKFFVLQELTFDGGNKEIRIGYYIRAKKGKRAGKWAWGQFCPFLPRNDLVKLIKKAQREGILPKEELTELFGKTAEDIDFIIEKTRKDFAKAKKLAK